ncbi:hypothetical protein J14TS2_41030 [Bacillus sp. J14TS2]|uniref:ABC transporter permease n=1 Tax=Bacillus sp. J14TS2 TaxID=2807188 RepID=UPI001B219E8F|nr:ABC transporter permease [Bacillus sp. J14TS2]GIN73628.1 hypothetical protein J14TS2_41030 [Bacillus sp. J14TS2]
MLKVIFKKESVLLLRSKFLAIPLMMNVLFWGYIVVSYEIKNIHMQERAAAFYSVFLWVLLFNILVLGLFAVYMTSKDRESEFEALVVTYRVKNSEWLIGKWLATQLYGLTITFITLLIQTGWFLTGKMAVGDVVKNIFYVFMQMEGALFFVISLAFLCGVALKNIFAYILVPAILTLSLGLPIDYTDTGTALWFDNPRLHLLTPIDLVYVGSPFEGIWGIHRVLGSTFMHQSAIFLLGVLVILIAVILFYPNRRIQKELKLVPILITIVIVPMFLLGGVRYLQYDQALKQFVTTAEPYVEGYEGSERLEEYYEWWNAYYESNRDHTKYDFSIERADLDVELQSDNQIAVASKLTIKHNGNKPTKEVKLTLYHGLQIMECTSESEITCTHDHDLITLQLDKMMDPGDQFDLDLNYQGNILQYSYEGYMENSFIRNNRVYLPKEAAWYPLIGERPLIVARERDEYYLQFEERNGSLVEDFPTAFTVKLANENSNVPVALTIPEIGAGMYEGTTQYGLSLVGGNIKETNVEQIRVVGHPEIVNATTETIKKYQKVWTFVEEWLDVPMTPEVIYILNDRHAYLAEDTPSQEVLIWSTDELIYSEHDEEVAYSAVSYLLDTGFSMKRSDDLSILFELVTWSVLGELEDVGNFKKWYEWPEKPQILDTLDEYETQGRLDDVVKSIYLYYADLEDKSEFNIKTALQLYEGEKGL